MKIKKNLKLKNYSAVLIALLSKKVWLYKQIFLVSILFKKVRERRVGWRGYPSVAAYSRKIFQVMIK